MNQLTKLPPIDDSKRKFRGLKRTVQTTDKIVVNSVPFVSDIADSAHSDLSHPMRRINSNPRSQLLTRDNSNPSSPWRSG